MKRLILYLCTSMTAFAVAAQDAPRTDDTALGDLLATPISTAAKYDQQMSDVPASVTAITAEEIARYGWRTLADVLNSVRGVYTTYDRGYSYLGIRGVGLPTDYNNRFLILIDGHPITDVVSGGVDIGSALGIDLSTLQRIEFVRGPSSVVYGTGAMLGVINLIPKDEDDHGAIMAGAGSDGTQIANGRAGFRSPAFRASIAGSWQQSNGGTLYFPEFDTPSTNHGIVRNRDYDDYHSALATFGWRGLKLLALDSSRTKGVPTASWGSSFGDDEETIDRRVLLGARLSHIFSPSRRLNITGTVDQFEYEGAYPSGPDYMWRDLSESTRMTLTAETIWDLRPNHRVTLGGRVIHAHHARYSWSDPFGGGAIEEPFMVRSAFAQSEWQPVANLSITTGASIDSYSNYPGSHATPRAAVIYHSSDRSTWKFLYGRGFRVPSLYEENFPPDDRPRLRAESSSTTEVVWEYRLTTDILTTASVYAIRMDDVLKQVLDSQNPEGYQNAGAIRTKGAEVQIDYRRGDGIWSYLSYSWQRAREESIPMANSPDQLVKAGISTPTSRDLQGALELTYGSARRTLAGNEAGDALLANINLTKKLGSYASLALTARNVFDTKYSLPAGPEHLQDSLVQDGRSVLVRLILRQR